MKEKSKQKLKYQKEVNKDSHFVYINFDDGSINFSVKDIKYCSINTGGK